MKKLLVATIATVLTLMAVMGVGGVGAGTADARWQETPRLGVLGDEVWSLGSNGCRGTMGIGLRNNPAKPGWVELRVRSRGFTKNDCKVTLRFTYHNNVPPFYHDRYYRIKGTKKAGPLLLQKKLWIGSGLDLVSITSTNPGQKPVNWYIAIP